MPVNTAITIRKGTGSQWSSTNPVLASGEPGYDLSNNILKIGDGVSNWNSLKNVASISGLITASSGNFNNLSVSGISVSTIGASNINANNRLTITNDAQGTEIYLEAASASSESTRIVFTGNNAPNGSIEADESLEILNFVGPWKLNNSGISVEGHTHTASNITNFNSSVSGLFPANLTTGVGTSGYLSRWNGVNSLTSGVIFDNGTSVGIGTTNPSGALHIERIVANNSYVLLSNPSNVVKTHIGVGNNDSVPFLASTNNIQLASGNNGWGFFDRATDGNLRLARRAGSTSWSDVLHINRNNGNIGIGTTTPSGLLDVAGDAYVRGTGNNLGTLYLKSTASPDTSLKVRADTNGNLFLDAVAYIKVGNQDGTAMVQGYTGPVTIGHLSNSNNNQNIIFNPRATERARLTHDGNFGIGTTSPSGRLHVVGTGLFASTTGLLPNALLDVYSTTSGEMVFNVEGTNGSLFSVIDNLSGSLMSVNNNAGLPVFEVFSDDSIIGGRFSQNDFVISSGGNIGIGKASPSVKLDVVGNVAVSGAFSATTKSFKIDHPSKAGYVLEYGSLESPYHGVRLTGKDTVVNGVCLVNLPEYIKDLVLDDDSINIQITNYKHNKILYVKNIKISHNTFTIGCDTNGLYDFFWTFTGLRKDIPQIVTEYLL